MAAHCALPVEVESPAAAAAAAAAAWAEVADDEAAAAAAAAAAAVALQSKGCSGAIEGYGTDERNPELELARWWLRQWASWHPTWWW